MNEASRPAVEATLGKLTLQLVEAEVELARLRHVVLLLKERSDTLEAKITELEQRLATPDQPAPVPVVER